MGIRPNVAEMQRERDSLIVKLKNNRLWKSGEEFTATQLMTELHCTSNMARSITAYLERIGDLSKITKGHHCFFKPKQPSILSMSWRRNNKIYSIIEEERRATILGFE